MLSQRVACLVKQLVTLSVTPRRYVSEGGRFQRLFWVNRVAAAVVVVVVVVAC